MKSRSDVPVKSAPIFTTNSSVYLKAEIREVFILLVLIMKSYVYSKTFLERNRLGPTHYFVIGRMKKKIEVSKTYLCIKKLLFNWWMIYTIINEYKVF